MLRRAIALLQYDTGNEMPGSLYQKAPSPVIEKGLWV